jgi:hypothetical protein
LNQVFHWLGAEGRKRNAHTENRGPQFSDGLPAFIEISSPLPVQ